MSIHRSPRLGTADHIAAMVAFLISDDGAWVNGQSLSVEGPFFGIRAVAPGMKAAGGGVIVNVSSSAAFLPSSHIGVYATSKWAVRGLTKAAALDLAPDGIRVCSLHSHARHHLTAVSPSDCHGRWLRQEVWSAMDAT